MVVCCMPQLVVFSFQDFLHRIFQAIKDIINAVLGRKEELNTLFKHISNGGYSNAIVKRSISDPALLSLPADVNQVDGEPRVTDFLNKDEVSRIINTMVMHKLKNNTSLEETYNVL